MANLSDNYRRFIRTLETIDDDIDYAALERIIENEKSRYHEILWTHAYTALVSSKEYAIPEFIEPLREAVFKDESIILGLDDLNRPKVVIDLETTAGPLSDYANAVRIARENLTTGTMDKVSASWYWKNFLYGQAREGKIIKRKSKKNPDGSTTEGKSRQQEGSTKYWATINERLAAMGTLAPYWSLIAYGNASGLGDGGTPYPSVAPNDFVTAAETEIYFLYNSAYGFEVDRLLLALERQDYGENGLLDQTVDMVESLGEAPTQSWTPGPIIEQIKSTAEKVKGILNKIKGWF